MLSKIEFLGLIVISFNESHRPSRGTLSTPNRSVVIVLDLDNTVSKQFYHIWQALKMLKVIPFMCIPKRLRPTTLITPVPASLFLSFRIDEFCFESHSSATNKVISRWTRLLIVNV